MANIIFNQSQRVIGLHVPDESNPGGVSQVWILPGNPRNDPKVAEANTLSDVTFNAMKGHKTNALHFLPCADGSPAPLIMIEGPNPFPASKKAA